MAAPFELAGDGPVELLPLALSRPQEALERAHAVLAADPSVLDASVARQVIGTVLRETGDIDAAVRELRTARALARRTGSADREADVLGTLGVALIFAGRTTSGRNALNAAVRRSTGHLHDRMVFRRGAALLILGRHDEALADLNSAIGAMRAAGDQIWEARALTERAVSNLSFGSMRPAVADLRRAERLFAANGQELESADATVHRGVLALRIGDLPEALTCFDEAAERFQRLGTSDPALSIYRCTALAAAGLAWDAMREADTAIRELERIHGRPTKHAELLLTAATCALAAGQASTALARATEARQLFYRQEALVAGTCAAGSGDGGGRRRTGNLRLAPGCPAVRPGTGRSLLSRPAGCAARRWPGRSRTGPDNCGRWLLDGRRGRAPAGASPAPGDRVAGRGAARASGWRRAPSHASLPAGAGPYRRVWRHARVFRAACAEHGARR